MCAASVDTGYSVSTDDPAAELANRVRKNAGVVLAMQIGSDPQYQPHQPLAFTAPPAPRIQRPTPPHPHLPPHPSPRAHHLCPRCNHGRRCPHMTIEHRYRTNLNVHIQSLYQVIPALRVVNRAAAIKVGEPYPGMPSCLHAEMPAGRETRSCTRCTTSPAPLSFLSPLPISSFSESVPAACPLRT
ncbi:hypothetical protein B0H16DRAFT_1743543 [Mycena metata]|uniref:Uncharacterized protein n=1 Tax=Mycena metata TaxID=1033252 RepID=A0AAD7H6M7_9AGAR|nr:hypothetical protein B0H16DRAFT_1743543 [Mycena metata]